MVNNYKSNYFLKAQDNSENYIPADKVDNKTIDIETNKKITANDWNILATVVNNVNNINFESSKLWEENRILIENDIWNIITKFSIK